MSEFPQRRQAVASALATQKVDALLVSSLASIRYLTGYVGSNGLLLVTPVESHFFTDPRYATDAQQNIDCAVHICKKGLYEEAAAIAKRKHVKHLGFEPAWMNVEPFERLKKLLGSGVKLQPVTGVVEDLRAIKSPAEIDRIRASVKANSEAYSKTLRRVKHGVRELDVAAELDFQMRMAGAEKTAFETIVASGPRTALPHAHPTRRKLEKDELLLIDMGAMLDGYCSDMTRMSFLGKPSKLIRRLYDAVLEAQLAGIAAVQAGVLTSRVDSEAREVLKRHELDQAFVHSTGHGLGLEIHEDPRIAKTSKSKLQAGMVITIEPGAYIEGLGGVRIEDTVLVTEKGCEILTPTPKELVQL
ncbi:MAG: Xaa-Pro peptidase family protein [Acidobacteriota bacterium]